MEEGREEKYKRLGGTFWLAYREGLEDGVIWERRRKTLQSTIEEPFADAPRAPETILGENNLD